MLVQTRTITVTKGHADQVVARFSEPGVLDKRDGLIDVSVMVNKRSKETEEVMVIIRWESEEAWKNWEKSPEHLQGHRDSRGQTPPDYILDTVVHMYDVKAVRNGQFQGQQT